MLSIRPKHYIPSCLRIRHSARSGRRHLHLLALTSVSAFLTFCAKTESGIPADTEETNITIKENTSNRINSVITVIGKYDSADIFIYRDSDGILEFHHHSYSHEGINVELWPGDYTAVTVTDSPYAFDCDALKSFDSIELLEYHISDDSRPVPISSAVTSFQAGDSVSIKVGALRSTVILQEITNNLGGYTRLEDPRIYLENANLQAEILRSSGFRSQEPGLSTPAKPLPYDIGIYTQHPAIELYCYPNDSEEASQTTPRTIFVFECEIQGQSYRFPYTLPPLHRGEVTNLSLSIDSEKEYICYQL